LLKKAETCASDWNETGLECVFVPGLMRMKLTAETIFGLGQNMDMDKLKPKRK